MKVIISEFRESNFDFVVSLLKRVACLGVLFYLAIHFEENPIVISIVGIISFLVFIFIGNDDIIIYNDRIVQKTNSIFHILSKKSTQYFLNDIKKAYLHQEIEKPGVFEIGVVLVLVSLFPNRHRRRSSRQSFYLELKDGKEIPVFSDLDNDKIKKIVEKINSLTR